MKHLYLKILELLSKIEEIQYIDLEYGQLQEEMPSISYPAALINMDLNKTESLMPGVQDITANFEIKLITKASDVNNLTPEKYQNQSLEFLQLQEKVFEKLQDYQDESLEPFERKGVRNLNIRKGLRVLSCNYETGWRVDLTN